MTQALIDEDDRLNSADLRTIWRILTPEERVEAFHLFVARPTPRSSSSASPRPTWRV